MRYDFITQPSEKQICFLAAGINGHIAKPIDIEKLGAVILPVLKKQESLQNGKNNSING